MNNNIKQYRGIEKNVCFNLEDIYVDNINNNSYKTIKENDISKIIYNYLDCPSLEDSNNTPNITSESSESSESSELINLSELPELPKSPELCIKPNEELNERLNEQLDDLIENIIKNNTSEQGNQQNFFKCFDEENTLNNAVACVTGDRLRGCASACNNSEYEFNVTSVYVFDKDPNNIKFNQDICPLKNYDLDTINLDKKRHKNQKNMGRLSMIAFSAMMIMGSAWFNNYYK